LQETHKAAGQDKVTVGKRVLYPANPTPTLIDDSLEIALDLAFLDNASGENFFAICPTEASLLHSEFPAGTSFGG
jgi:hypothetical protein